MTDFNVRSDSVDVEQIMRQIRARIRDKRGVDYTEEQIRELANAKLERFLDPSGVRSGLLEEFRRRPAPPPPPTYVFEDTTLFESDKAIVRFFRRLLRPILKLFFNPNQLTTVLHTQAAFNRWTIDQQQDARHALYYEVIHNLVLEMTRVSIEAKNMKMRLESLQGRLEFNERRARALEAVVQYKRDALTSPRDEEVPGTEPQGGIDPITEGESLRTRRRRRRRGRRAPGQPGAAGIGTDEAGGDDQRADMEPGTAQPAEVAEEAARVHVTPGHLTITGRQGTPEHSTDASAPNPAEAGSHGGEAESTPPGGGSPSGNAESNPPEEGFRSAGEDTHSAEGGSHTGAHRSDGDGAPGTPRDSEPQ